MLVPSFRFCHEESSIVNSLQRSCPDLAVMEHLDEGDREVDAGRVGELERQHVERAYGDNKS